LKLEENKGDDTMKRFLRSFALCLTMLFFICDIGFAVIGDTITTSPSPYKITMKKVRLQNSVTGEWVTVGEGDLTVDIASVNAGELAAGYVSGSAVPEGTYNNIEITVSTSMTIKASCVDTTNKFGSGAVTWYTTSTAGAGGSIQASTVVGNYAEGTSIIPNTVVGVDPVAGTFTKISALPSILSISKGSTQRIRVKFDVANSVTFSYPGLGTFIAYPGEPTVEMQIID